MQSKWDSSVLINRSVYIQELEDGKIPSHSRISSVPTDSFRLETLVFSTYRAKSNRAYTIGNFNDFSFPFRISFIRRLRISWCDRCQTPILGTYLDDWKSAEKRCVVHPGSGEILNNDSKGTQLSYEGQLHKYCSLPTFIAIPRK